MSDGDRDQQLVDRTRAALERSADELDAPTLSRLAQMRASALERAEAAQPRARWLPAGALAAASAAGLLWLLFPANTDPTPTDALEDLELLSSAESLDLLDELEFYEWLEGDGSVG